MNLVEFILLLMVFGGGFLTTFAISYHITDLFIKRKEARK